MTSYTLGRQERRQVITLDLPVLPKGWTCVDLARQDRSSVRVQRASDRDYPIQIHASGSISRDSALQLARYLCALIVEADEVDALEQIVADVDLSTGETARAIIAAGWKRCQS